MASAKRGGAGVASASAETVDAREERLAARGRNRMYFNSLQDLKRVHRRLFDKDGRFTVVHRYVTSADSGVLLLEAALRLPASDKDWRRKVVAAYRRLEVDYPSAS